MTDEYKAIRYQRDAFRRLSEEIPRLVGQIQGLARSMTMLVDDFDRVQAERDHFKDLLTKVSTGTVSPQDIDEAMTRGPKRQLELAI